MTRQCWEPLPFQSLASCTCWLTLKVLFYSLNIIYSALQCMLHSGQQVTIGIANDSEGTAAQRLSSQVRSQQVAGKTGAVCCVFQIRARL